MAEAPKQSSNRPAESTASKGRQAPPGASSGASSSTAGGELVNRQLGDFLLLRRLGSGGMGEVYLAQQLSLKRQVALKVLRQEVMSDETARRRFAVEAEAAAKLTHSNIVQIFASGEQDGISYMALEYVQGMNLRDYVSKKGPATLKFAIRVMEQVAAALHHAAEAGIVHRDIKPDNILLTRKGEVKVGDFGLARLRVEKPVNLTQPGVTMGTPLYMSPEQVEGRALDSRSDLYSFGATCYYMLAGNPPFRGDTALAIAIQHLRKDPDPLETLRSDLPAEVCRIVHKLMAKHPDQRYQTGRQLLRDLQKVRIECNMSEAEHVVENELQAPVVEMPQPEVDRPDRRRFTLDRLRRSIGWWVAASLLVALLCGAGAGWYYRAPDLRPRAVTEPKPAAPPRWEDIPKKETAEAQYRFATWAGQDVNAEAAWTAVINHWSNESDWVLIAQMELGKHYMTERQLDKADGLFAEMASSFDERTRLVGEVGKAMLLSFRERPGESQSALWDHVRDAGVGLDRKTPGGPSALADRTLISMILWTFERNYRDLGIDWDDEVRRWANRRMPRFRPPPGLRPGEPPVAPATPGRSANGQRDRS